MKRGHPLTQRNGVIHDTRSNVGRNSTKHTVNATQSHINTSSMLQQNNVHLKTGTNSMNKMSINTTIGHKTSEGDQVNKENKQRLSNRQGLQSATDTHSLTLKRNKTSEGVYRNSMVGSRSSHNGTIILQPQEKELIQEKSKSSEHDEKLSIATSNRNNS
jgi:hypothetical protein